MIWTVQRKLTGRLKPKLTLLCIQVTNCEPILTTEQEVCAQFLSLWAAVACQVKVEGVLDEGEFVHAACVHYGYKLASYIEGKN